MKKKVLAILLTAAVSVGMLAGCGSEQKEESSQAPQSSAAQASSEATSGAASSEAAEPEELTYPMDTDVTLRVYIGGGQPLSSTQTDYADVPFWQGLEKNIGIDCEWEYPVAGADATAAYNLMLTEEELPHIVIGYYTAAATMSELLADGIAINIDEYIEEYAPDYYEFIMSDETETNRLLHNVEGTIPCFIAARDSDWGCCYTGPLIRQDWLDEQGLEIPKTFSELENVLKVFKEKYNAFFVGPANRAAHAFVGAFDAFAGTTANWFVDDDGTVKLGNAQPEYKDWLTAMNKWYNEGLLDPNFATANDTYVAQMALEGKIGVSYSAISQQTKWLQEAEGAGVEADWVGFANPTNENGDILKYIQTAYTTSGSYGAYVTNACDTEEELRAAMAWLNWAYTEEGILYWNFGTEGESFEYVDGKPKFAALLTEDERGIEQALRDYTGASAMPVGVQMEYFVRAKNSDAAGDSVDRWVSNQNARAYIVPGLPLTADEKKELTDITTPMNTYIAEIALKFITGEEPLDHFDKYLETLDTMGLERANEIQNEGYQRFMGK